MEDWITVTLCRGAIYKIPTGVEFCDEFGCFVFELAGKCPVFKG